MGSKPAGHQARLADARSIPVRRAARRCARIPGDLAMNRANVRTPGIGIDSVAQQARLVGLWDTAPGLKGFLSTVDHKQIGIRYIVTAFIFLALGGIEALIMRVQLAGPNLSLLTPD